MYYIRAFEFAGGLIRMVFKVLICSGPFLTILMIVTLGATNCYFVLFRYLVINTYHTHLIEPACTDNLYSSSALSK
jgi:hypothetical protein